jgi:antitoxin MazE
MIRKVFRAGNSLVVSLPRETQEFLNLRLGSEIQIDLDKENNQVTIKPAEMPLVISGVDDKFASQVAEFIDQYRSALEKLSK